MNKTKCLHAFFHVAYADDHVTIMVLKVKKSECVTKTKGRINAVAGICRDLLDRATKAVGCGINPDKSELIVPPRYCDGDATGSKVEFVWLGYSLKVTDDRRVMFTDTKLVARINKTVNMACSIFQYLKSVFVRWRVYKVYIAPIIEWYLPTMAHKPRTAGSKANLLESFQHRLLAMVSGACRSCNRSGLEEVMREMPVRFKIAKMAARMSRYVSRDVAELLIGTGVQQGLNRMSLRRGRSKNNFCKWKGADKYDLGDQLYIFKDIWLTWHDKDMYAKGNPRYVPFNLRVVTNWVKRTNAEIKRKIKEREIWGTGTRDIFDFNGIILKRVQPP